MSDKRWRLRFICCGRADGHEEFDTWEAANAVREEYTSGPAVDPHGYSGVTGYHQRAAILEAVSR